ncbi:MAG: hypothetical protein R3F20_05675 [Planctomycetota bacterium]
MRPTSPTPTPTPTTPRVRPGRTIPTTPRAGDGDSRGSGVSGGTRVRPGGTDLGGRTTPRIRPGSRDDDSGRGAEAPRYGGSSVRPDRTDRTRGDSGSRRTPTEGLSRYAPKKSESSRLREELRGGRDGSRFGDRSKGETLGRGGVAGSTRRESAGKLDVRPRRQPPTVRPAKASPYTVLPGVSSSRPAPSGRGYLPRPNPNVTEAHRTFTERRRSHGGYGVGRHRDHDSWSFGLFVGTGAWSIGFSAGHHGYYDYGRSASFHFGFGGGPWYTNSYLHSAGYAPYWHSHYWGNPFYRGSAYYSGFGRYSRFHFGYSHYYPYCSYTPYPLYRWGYYEPYYVSCYASALPVYRTYYYVNRPVSRRYYAGVYYDDFVEAGDPYVDEEVVIDVSEVDAVGYVDDGDAIASVPLAPALGSIPSELSTPFVTDFPSGLSFEEYLAYGEEALYSASYLPAAEAFRRALLARESDDYTRFQLAVALFGAGRYALGGELVASGLDLNPAWLFRRFDIADGFASRAEFDSRVSDLERHLVTDDEDHGARFMLAYVYYYSGNLFGARNLLRVLDDRGVAFEGADAMAKEAEQRLTKAREGR